MRSRQDRRGVGGGRRSAGRIPWLAVLPFVGFLFRALWAVRQVRPVNNIKRFGFTEIGVEILGGLIIAMSWLV